MIYSGPKNAKIMMIGEAPGVEELKRREPFVGTSGWYLDQMLNDAGLNRNGIFLCNVIDERPASGNISDWFVEKKGEIKKLKLEPWRGRYTTNPNIPKAVQALPEIVEAINPNVVVALGDLALWALTGEVGITKWRGSIMEMKSYSDELGEQQFGPPYKVIPTFNPAYVYRNYPQKWIVTQDFRRVRDESLFNYINYPKCNYIINPTFTEAMEALERVRGSICTCDIEVWSNQIACVGFGFSRTEACCIPFMTTTKESRSYWTQEEELAITLKMRSVLTDPQTRLIFHHAHFDCQFFIYQWGYIPNVYFDTMVAQHVAFANLRKGLDFISSIYCDYYRFWKEDGKYWDPRIHSEDQYWGYNCDDCCYTFEDYEVLSKTLKSFGCERATGIQMSLIKPTLKMMIRGVKLDLQFKNKMRGDLQNMMTERMEWLETAVGHPINPLSNHPNGDMRKLFYNDLQLTPVINRKTKRPALDDAALETIKHRSPILSPLIEKIQEVRSINTFKGNFAEARASADGRARCQIKISTVKTYRFSTGINEVTNEGMNLQNISKGTKEKD